MLAQDSLLELLGTHLQIFDLLIFLLYNLFMNYCKFLHLTTNDIADFIVDGIYVLIQLFPGLSDLNVEVFYPLVEDLAGLQRNTLLLITTH